MKGQDDELKLELEYGKALVKACLLSLSMLFCWAQEASAVRVLSMMAAGGLNLPAVMQRVSEDEGAIVLVYDCRPQPHQW